MQSSDAVGSMPTGAGVHRYSEIPGRRLPNPPFGDRESLARLGLSPMVRPPKSRGGINHDRFQAGGPPDQGDFQEVAWRPREGGLRVAGLCMARLGARGAGVNRSSRGIVASRAGRS
jgi:hypothetical protein